MTSEAPHREPGDGSDQHLGLVGRKLPALMHRALEQRDQAHAVPGILEVAREAHSAHKVDHGGVGRDVPLGEEAVAPVR